MICIHCRSHQTKVIASTDRTANDIPRRRVLCKTCGARFNTYEIPDPDSLQLPKTPANLTNLEN